MIKRNNKSWRCDCMRESVSQEPRSNLRNTNSTRSSHNHPLGPATSRIPVLAGHYTDQSPTTYDVHTASSTAVDLPTGPGLLCIRSTGLVVHQWGTVYRTVLSADGSARQKGRWHVNWGGALERKTRRHAWASVFLSCSSQGRLERAGYGNRQNSQRKEAHPTPVVQLCFSTSLCSQTARSAFIPGWAYG